MKLEETRNFSRGARECSLDGGRPIHEGGHESYVRVVR